MQPCTSRPAAVQRRIALLSAGVGSSVAEVAALSMDAVAKLVAAAGAAQARPLLPDLVPPLLESLSTLEVRPCRDHTDMS